MFALADRKYCYLVLRNHTGMVDITDQVSLLDIPEASYLLEPPYASGAKVRCHIGSEVYMGVILRDFDSREAAAAYRGEIATTFSGTSLTSKPGKAVQLDGYWLKKAAHEAFGSSFPRNRLFKLGGAKGHPMEDAQIVWQHPTAEKNT